MRQICTDEKASFPSKHFYLKIKIYIKIALIRQNKHFHKNQQQQKVRHRKITAQLQAKLTVTNSKTEPAKQNYPWHTNVTKAFRN